MNKALLTQPNNRAGLTLPAAVALLLAQGVPIDTGGAALCCAYCGVTTDERRAGVPHRPTCCWAALGEVARREGVTW